MKNSIYVTDRPKNFNSNTKQMSSLLLFQVIRLYFEIAVKWKLSFLALSQIFLFTYFADIAAICCNVSVMIVSHFWNLKVTKMYNKTFRC